MPTTPDAPTDDAPAPAFPTPVPRLPAEADLLVRGARSDRLEEDLAAAGVTEAFAAASGFKGQAHRVLVVPSPDAEGPDRLVVGVGAAAEVDAARLREITGTVARRTTHHADVVVDLVPVLADGLEPAPALQAISEGWVLGAYRFDQHRSEPSESRLASVAVVTSGKGGKAAVERGVTVAAAVNATRDLVNQPGAELVPTDLVDRIKEVAAETGLKVRVDSVAGIRQRGFGGVAGVAQGSSNEPRFVELTYEPKGRARGHIALVGKGVTFDTGGYSLKPSDSMKGMNGDMGGAAAVVGAMSLLGALGAKVKVTGYLPLVENMIGPDAIRVGDVLTIRGGTTVEVLNTDAEGRLILADALRAAAGAEPDAIIDVATLTGACMAALGPRVAGLFGRGGGLVDRVRSVADEVGEAVWPLPMPEHLRSGLDSDVADIRNIGSGRLGGASVAALFLRHFVPDEVPWAHLDIAGPSWNTESAHGEVPKLATGFAVRTLAALCAGWEPLPG